MTDNAEQAVYGLVALLIGFYVVMFVATLIGRYTKAGNAVERTSESPIGRMIGSFFGRLLAGTFVLFIVGAALIGAYEMLFGRGFSGCGAYSYVGAECPSD
jgi:uncharacterized membrane protein required for colicin V production